VIFPVVGAAFAMTLAAFAIARSAWLGAWTRKAHSIYMEWQTARIGVDWPMRPPCPRLFSESDKPRKKGRPSRNAMTGP